MTFKIDSSIFIKRPPEFSIWNSQLIYQIARFPLSPLLWFFRNDCKCRNTSYMSLLHLEFLLLFNRIILVKQHIYMYVRIWTHCTCFYNSLNWYNCTTERFNWIPWYWLWFYEKRRRKRYNRNKKKIARKCGVSGILILLLETTIFVVFFFLRANQVDIFTTPQTEHSHSIILSSSFCNCKIAAKLNKLTYLYL